MEKLCYSVFRSHGNEYRRYRINWFVISCVNVLMGITYFIEAPLLHQYITSKQQRNPHVESGLGLSEEWYSGIITVGSIGVVVGAVVYGVVSKYIYVKLGIVVELILELVGGVLYAFGYNKWFILVSKFFNGVFIGMHQSLMRNYAVETSEKIIQTLPREKRDNSTIKYTVLFIMFCLAVFGMALGPLIPALGMHIPSISKFHWPGYYICFHALLLLVLVLLVFSDRWNDIVRTKGEKATTCLKKKLPIPYYLIVVFIYFYFVFGWNMSIVETLQNPILSDHFGLNIEDTSYIFIGVFAICLVSTVITYCFQKIHLDNRKILIVAFIVGITGGLIMTDWQSMRADPCNQLTLQSFNKTYGFEDNSYLNCSDIDSVICSAMIDFPECAHNSSDFCYCTMFNNVSSYECYWNPVSRVTGQYCERCRPVCLSKAHTLKFIQLFVGVVLLSACFVPGRLLVTTIASDIAGNHSQGFLMGILVAAGALSRSTGPLWGNPAYLYVGHRTWLAMSIMIGALIVALISLIILYKRMKKIISPQGVQTIEDTANLLTIEFEIASNEV